MTFTDIEDRLPENDGPYLVSILIAWRSRTYDIALFSVEYGSFISYTRYVHQNNYTVTHWADLPKHPE